MGVVLNLSIWVSLHTVFATVFEQHAYAARLLIPDGATIDPAPVFIAAAAFVAMFRFEARMIPTLVVSAAAGLGHYLIARS